MQLKDILKGMDYTLVCGSIEDKEIHDICYDSRKVEENDLFVALEGYQVDGHEYIPEAIQKKARVIVLSKMVPIHEEITVIKVENTRIALALLSSNFFQEPTKKLILIGVTGTTGKTTTSHMIQKMLNEVGCPCGMIGSIGVFYQEQFYSTHNTTPESYEIEKYLKEMVDHGITHVVMETSSQAFKMHRLAAIEFDIGVLTNITSDHIGENEHATQEEYVHCKRELFLHSKKIIVNNDSLYLNEVLDSVKAPIKRYAIKKAADLNAINIELLNQDQFLGVTFDTFGLINESFQINIPGKFNVYNALATILVGYELNIDISKIKEALQIIYVRGRMENVSFSSKFKILIDYAHTTDGLKNLVETLKEYHPKRLVSIFGAGGNRAKERRYSLGTIIGSSSDLCILTMDNPRFEEISQINQDIKKGLNKVNAKYIEIDDRAKAIEYALTNFEEGDLIVLIGKGHEEYQDIKGIMYPFSERKIIEELRKNVT